MKLALWFASEFCLMALPSQGHALFEHLVVGNKIYHTKNLVFLTNEKIANKFCHQSCKRKTKKENQKIVVSCPQVYIYLGET